MAGCGGEVVPPLAQVSGVLTDEAGTPLDGVKVMFLPDPEAENFGQPSSGETDDQGKFTLYYDGNKQNPGAAVGKNRVILRDIKATRSSRDETPMARRFSEKYVTANSTDLSFDVKNEAGQSFEIKVSK